MEFCALVHHSCYRLVKIVRGCDLFMAGSLKYVTSLSGGIFSSNNNDLVRNSCFWLAKIRKSVIHVDVFMAYFPSTLPACLMEFCLEFCFCP